MNIPSLTKVKPHCRSFFHSAGMRPFVAFLIGIGFVSGVLFGQDTGASNEGTPPKESPSAAAPSGATLEALVAAARERAKLLHDVYSTTLDVMHHRYFSREGPVLPARAMEDIFDEMAGLSGTMANWISVNTKAMSINHEPTTLFEKQAAEALAAGKEDYERVGKAVYQRAVAIPLRSSCVGCHTKMFSDAPKSPRFAGLVISIPLKVEKK